ncbi:hypothetical protein SAMN05421736_1417 [Evansella caseinilytica]|uniref:Uncharacterized protein n=1 Tax=Evansella caseinilytica TaxID=1503961 RepID=A0A1H3V3R1_9BACI|nr:contact-dependent growth inhibition system immunity protein [Evansella caseinilytica]SDZ68861.1 hypothetical protein SAMN05421736_1417 [Evansella caseinilytica]
MKTIREIYQISESKSQSNYALDIWYNDVLNKSVSELGIVDLCRMIKQNVFIELAISKALELLKLNPLEGDVYDGQLLELLFKVDKDKIRGYEESLKEILMNAKENVDIDNFMCKEEYDEFKDLVEKFLTKVNSY